MSGGAGDSRPCPRPALPASRRQSSQPRRQSSAAASRDAKGEATVGGRIQERGVRHGDQGKRLSRAIPVVRPGGLTGKAAVHQRQGLQDRCLIFGALFTRIIELGKEFGAGREKSAALRVIRRLVVI